MGEETNGAMSGAMQGAQAGSAFSPYGMAAGAVIGGVGGYLSGRSKKKAAQERLRKMKQALNMFQAGSTDAYGNTLSAGKDGKWKYDLSLATQKAKQAADKANIAAGNYNYRSGNDLRKQTYAANMRANQDVAKANAAASMSQGLRTNSNLGNISNAISRQNSQDLLRNYRNGYYQAMNPEEYNAQNVNNLSIAATNAQAPVSNIQQTLQQMVNSLNTQEMNQMNQIAGAAANPMLHGQNEANLISAIGSGINGFNKQQQDNAQFDNLLKVLQGYGNKDGANLQDILSLIAMMR